MNLETSRRPGRVRNPITHRAILDAARQSLAAHDYGSISIEQIARLAGIGKPTIYRWWPTKAALFMELYSEDASRLFTISDKQNLQEELRLFFDATWRLWQDTTGGRAYRSIIAETQQNKDAFTFFTQTFLPIREQPLREIFERAIARGELPSNIVDTLIALIFGFNWYHLLINTPPTEEECLKVIQLLIGRTK